MTQDQVEEYCWENKVPKSRMAAYITLEIGDVSQRVKVKDIQHPEILQMALSLTDARHRNPVYMVVHKIGRTKIRVFGLGKQK